MNRNHIKALLLIGVLGTFAANAAGQIGLPTFPPPNVTQDPLLQDWVFICEDPTSTTSPYSTDWAIEYQYDALFGAVMGVSGTVNFSKYCFPTSGVTLPMAGRLGFYIGTDPYQLQPNGQADPNYGKGGSTQDNLMGTPVDDGLGLTFGTYTGVSGNFSIANIVQATTTAGTGTTAGTTTTKLEYFGKNAIDTAYWGVSGRYFIGESTASLGARVQLRVDVIGDAARCQWTLTNTVASTGGGGGNGGGSGGGSGGSGGGGTTNSGTTALGLWFGQWVEFLGPQGSHTADYVTAPGLRPLDSDTRFGNALYTTPPTNLTPLAMIPYLDYGLDQSWAYGLQIVLQPSQQMQDQTAADGIDVGKNGFLLGSMTASDGAMPDVLVGDTTMLTGADAYIEMFNPTPVGAPGTGTETKTIVAYYRSTWSSADYTNPYSVVLDAPPVIATTPGQPNTFQFASPVNITVDVDNTGSNGGGFSQNGAFAPLEDVQITLNLPPGMTDANNPNSNQMVQYLSSVPPQSISHVTFQVAIDPTLFGAQQYSVTVVPNPGPTKTLTGSIQVASQPYLQLTGTANLVTAPWQFNSSDWATIIGANTNLVIDQDFQVFGWDASAQDYILQTDPQRGFGSFIVTNQNVGFVPLGGGPQQVSDLQSGAPQIILQPGWNLIANPYNYGIPVGQLVGIPEADDQKSYTFTDLANAGYVSSSLSYWDAQSQGYNSTEGLSDILQPNTGYWIFVESNLPVTLEYMQVFQAFLPGIPDNLGNAPPKKTVGTAAVNTPIWTLQLAARSNNMIDAKTTIGQTTTSQLAGTLTRYKAPIAPVKNAISSSILVQKGTKSYSLAQALAPQSVTSQTWTWNVYTQSAGEVTLTWPNMSAIPSNIQIKLVDPSTGAQHLLRSTNSISFASKAQSVKSYELVVTSGPTLPVIESVTVASAKAAATIDYTLSVNATTTVTITQGSKLITTLVSNRQDTLGKQMTTWNYADSANRAVANGTYQAVVTSTPSGGSASTKSVSITVKR